jgi:hypothetical protein
MVKEETVTQFLDRLRPVIEDVVKAELSPTLKPLLYKLARMPAEDTKLPVVRGVELSPAELVKARDLRMALLLGKLPDDAGLLIDLITMAKLLDISRRTHD